MTIILAMIANAFGRRFAGGLLGQWLGNIGGTQVARLAQAVIARDGIPDPPPLAEFYSGALLGLGLALAV